MRTLVGGLFLCAGVMHGAAGAIADPIPDHSCDNRSDVLGVSRTIEVDTSAGAVFGTLQYEQTLDLGPKEVVLTFDDGPHVRNTMRILDALDAECVKATFFPVGLWAGKLPEILQDVHRRGHTIGAHSWSHPRHLGKLPLAKAKQQIEKGFQAVEEAVGEPIAPFFRFPGLNDSQALIAYATRRGYGVFSCDIGTDDWRGISAKAIVRRTLARLERQGGGIVLFHDTKATTAAAVPVLLGELKARGYKVVHIVPRRPAPEGEPAMSMADVPAKTIPVGYDGQQPPVQR